MSRFLDTLAERVIIYDGAMGTNIQSYQLSAEDFGGESRYHRHASRYAAGRTSSADPGAGLTRYERTHAARDRYRGGDVHAGGVEG